MTHHYFIVKPFVSIGFSLDFFKKLRLTHQ